VEAEIRVSGGQGIDVDEVGELAALLEWLRGERGLAGAIREVRRPPGPGELGGAVEVLAVALGAGGSAGTLARSLFGWLRTRRPSLKVTVTKGARSITIEACDVRDGDVPSLLREMLEAGDGL
jgi:Effector Associated Constant Component 1